MLAVSIARIVTLSRTSVWCATSDRTPHPVRRRKSTPADHLHHLTKMVALLPIPQHLKGSLDRPLIPGATTLDERHRLEEPNHHRLII